MAEADDLTCKKRTDKVHEIHVQKSKIMAGQTIIVVARHDTRGKTYKIKQELAN